MSCNTIINDIINENIISQERTKNEYQTLIEEVKQNYTVIIRNENNEVMEFKNNECSEKLVNLTEILQIECGNEVLM